MSGASASGDGKDPKPDPPKYTETTDALVFANDCAFFRGKNNVFECKWDNGTAVEAVRGASIDYVEPRFHFAGKFKGQYFEYNTAADFGRLVSGGVKPVLAAVIVGMRKVVMSLKDSKINFAECRISTEDEEKVELVDEHWNVLETNKLAYNALLDAGPTILGCNGLSMLAKGHNYDGNDGMWTRLNEALGMDRNCSALKIPDFAGALYHDALHPFEVEWKTALVTDLSSTLVGHVNGVVLKRMPGTPAGTALVFVLAALVEELTVVNSKTVELFGPLHDTLTWLGARIRGKPLDWCTNFQRSMTADNLAIVAALEPVAAVAYGVAAVMLPAKASVLKSKALSNVGKRLAGHQAIGREVGEILGAMTIKSQDVDGIIGNYVDTVIGAVKLFQDEAEKKDKGRAAAAK